MKPIVWASLLWSMLALAGCGLFPSFPPTNALPSQTTIASQTTLVSQTPSTTPELATFTPVAPPTPGVSASGQTAAASTPLPPPSAGPGSAAGIATYTSPALGIRFNYAPDQGGQKVAVQESGGKVLLYPANMAPAAGQWVQVWTKPATQSLEDAIKAQVLKGSSALNCPVVKSANPNGGAAAPASYTFARIQVPQAANDTPPTLQARAGKCPQPYAAVGGLAYFLADTLHPDKFAFFSIGQYAILAGNNEPWQATLQFVEAAATASPSRITPTDYVDDRSTAQSLMTSFVSALNRKEYLRAYSYWETPETKLGRFSRFEQGYADTAAVELTIGTVGVDVGAGQLYYTVPVIMTAQTTAGTTQRYVGCYTLHLAQPANQAVPFHSLGIQSAQVHLDATGASAAVMLARACQGTGIRPTSPAAPVQAFAAEDITAARYLDDRTDAAQVLRSLYNAINRTEYARAYGYWTPGTSAQQLPPFPQFQQGYATTRSVQLTTGKVESDVGAGQLYYKVPVTLVAQNADGTTQTFVGCYTLHLSQPAVQGAPPYQPLSIVSAKNNPVANNASTTDLMSQACQ